MRKTGGAGGGAGSPEELAVAALDAEADSVTTSRGASAAAVSSGGAASAATAGGASRPQSQSEDPRVGAGGASFCWLQQECVSGVGSTDSVRGHGSPRSQ